MYGTTSVTEANISTSRTVSPDTNTPSSSEKTGSSQRTSRCAPPSSLTPWSSSTDVPSE